MKLASLYVQFVDRVNRQIGRAVMYGIFAMILILLWSSVSKATSAPSLWTLETAQFALVAYYVLGGPYALQLGANVRMDLFYGRCPPKRKAQIDAITVLFLLFYLAILLHGGLNSLAYSLGHYKGDTYSFFANLLIGAESVGRLEVSATAWRPHLWPVKLTFAIGVALMLLQAISELLKDIAKIRGVQL